MISFFLSTTVEYFIMLLYKERTIKKNANLVFNLYKNSKITDIKKLPKVLIIYPTCDDFYEECAKFAIDQDYKNFQLIIGDDSKTDKYKSMVDVFCNKYNIKISRRMNSIG
jgi:cellulose synthase/poly-beta-1,6-N-acetylglucosamine synthase-like glycosyltransferase